MEVNLSSFDCKEIVGENAYVDVMIVALVRLCFRKNCGTCLNWGTGMLTKNMKTVLVESPSQNRLKKEGLNLKRKNCT